METKSKIRDYLLTLGFLPNKCGYRFVFDIISLGISDDEILPLKYKAYKILADRYSKSESSIEKDIQNAIGSAWLKADVTKLYTAFGETIDLKKGKPSNKQFLVTAINSLKENIK